MPHLSAKTFQDIFSVIMKLQEVRKIAIILESLKYDVHNQQYTQGFLLLVLFKVFIKVHSSTLKKN